VTNSNLLDRELRAVSDSAFLRRLGCEVASVGDGAVEVRLPFNANNCNRAGRLHGGVTARMALVASNIAGADSQRGDAQVSMRPSHLSISYLSAPEETELIGRAHVVHRGRDVAHVAAEIQTMDGTPVATARVAERVFQPDDEAAEGMEDSDSASPVSKAFREMGDHTVTRVGGSAFLRASEIAIYTEPGDWTGACLPVGPNEGLPGALHEGAVAALADSCGAYSSYSGAGISLESTSATVAMSLSFAVRRPGPVCAAGRLVARTGTHFSNQVEVFEAEGGRITAFGSVTYRIVAAQ
jgi:uncharacterized protein (TIGR00369 family)